MNGFDTTNANRWLSRNSVKIAWAFAVLCLLIALANITWHIRTNYVAKKANYAPQEQFKFTASKAPTYRIHELVNANLFGDPSPQPVAKKAPKTTLNLTLQGILWATNSDLGRAIIKSGNKESQLYSVGEKIEGANASVREIRNNEVILDRNGASESLPIVKLKGGEGIISYVSDDNPFRAANFTPTAAPSLPVNTTNFRRSSSSNSSTTETKRRIRKPNFSGLDRALKKAGEI